MGQGKKVFFSNGPGHLLFFIIVNPRAAGCFYHKFVPVVQGV